MNQRPRERRPPPGLDYSLILLAHNNGCSKRSLKTGFSLNPEHHFVACQRDS